MATKAEYFLNKVDLNAGECEFLRLDTEAYRRSAFMDHRIQSDNQDTVHAPLEVMENIARDTQATTQPGQTNYILHTSFCCSTLISKCLDIRGICQSLREPPVLMQIANYKRISHPYYLDGARWQALIDTVVFLLAKSAGTNEVALIKPTNSANNLAEEIIQHPRTNGVLLLYSGLERFLITIIRRNEEGRAFVRRLFNIIQMDSERTRALPPQYIARLTDLQVAAFSWYLQVDLYLKLLDSFPDAKIRTLDCDRFLAEPMQTLGKLCDLFGIKAGAEVLQDVIAGPILKKHSKNNSIYDHSIRESEYEKVSKEYRTTLDTLLAWSDQIRTEGPLKLPLPQAL
ncbi:MAG: hypothetical protein ACRDHZ_05780 [Ktedonobacteraceae bacterium]